MNLIQMMRQAQEMQSRMADMQAALGQREVTGVSGGGMVKVTLNGKGDMRAVAIDPELLKPEEAGVLADLLLAAHADARIKVQAEQAAAMSELTGGLQLPPGMTLPFPPG